MVLSMCLKGGFCGSTGPPIAAAVAVAVAVVGTRQDQPEGLVVAGGFTSIAVLLTS